MDEALYAGDHLLGTREFLPESIDNLRWSYRFTPQPDFAAYGHFFRYPHGDESGFIHLLALLCPWIRRRREKELGEWFANLDGLDLRVVGEGLPELRFHYVMIHGNEMTCRAGAIRGALGRGAAHHAPRAVAGTPEGFLHGLLSPHKHVGARPHIAGDQYGLARLAELLRQRRVAGREGAGGPLAVDAEGHLFPVHDVLFDLGDVVADVVDEPHAETAGAQPEGTLESLARPVHEHLPVGPGVIGRAGHGRKILPSFRGLDVGAGQLTVGQRDAELIDMLHQSGQVVVAYLVPEAAGAAVDHHGNLADLDPQGGGRIAVEDLLDDLHFEEVIPGAQGSHLVFSPLQGALADFLGVGPGEAAAVYNGGERREELRIFTLHPDRTVDRLVTLTYAYPAGDREESGARFNEGLLVRTTRGSHAYYHIDPEKPFHAPAGLSDERHYN